MIIKCITEYDYKGIHYFMCYVEYPTEGLVVEHFTLEEYMAFRAKV